ncbi:hypothetical protein C8J56DRAFT_884850 [Mycena floridula]|nr:hypothetical protein C8J56DRAFT_884850 [Mycena floridula]
MFARTPKQQKMLKRSLNRRKQLLEALEARVHAYLLKVETDIETQFQLLERQQQQLQQPPLDDLERMALQDAILASLEADIEANLQQAQERTSRLESSIHWETQQLDIRLRNVGFVPDHSRGATACFIDRNPLTKEQRCKRIRDYYKLAETECREEEIIAQACLQEQSPILRQKLEVQLQEELAKQRDVKFDLTMELVTQVLNLGESAEDEAKFQSLCLQLQALSASMHFVCDKLEHLNDHLAESFSFQESEAFVLCQKVKAAMQMQKITLVSDDVIRGALGKLTGNSATDWEQDAGKRAKVIKRAFFIYSLRPLDNHGESLLALDIIKARRPIHEAFKIKAAELRARMVRERAELEENLVQDHLRLLSIQQGLQLYHVPAYTKVWHLFDCWDVDGALEPSFKVATQKVLLRPKTAHYDYKKNSGVHTMAETEYMMKTLRAKMSV